MITEHDKLLCKLAMVLAIATGIFGILAWHSKQGPDLTLPNLDLPKEYR